MDESKKKLRRKPPYVAAGTLWQFLNKLKFVSVPPHLDARELEEYGIPKNWAYHLLSTLKFLNLVEKNGKTTAALQSLQMRGDEYKHNLEDVVRNAYADLFLKIDPAKDSRANILNFFMKHYNTSPSGADKATTLFLDLCGEAGIPTLEEKPARKDVGAKPAISRGIKKQVERPEEEKVGLAETPLSDDELRKIYLRRLIDQVSPPDTAGKDAEAIKAEAQLRKAELDRIEELLGMARKKEKEESAGEELPF